MGGAIERKVNDTIKLLYSEEYMLWYGDTVIEIMSRSEPRPVKSARQRSQTKLDAYKKLLLVVPDALGQMVGKLNAKRGTQKMFAMLQNE